MNIILSLLSCTDKKETNKKTDDQNVKEGFIDEDGGILNCQNDYKSKDCYQMCENGYMRHITVGCDNSGYRTQRIYR